MADEDEILRSAQDDMGTQLGERNEGMALEGNSTAGR
jgi:hypothetical protein